MDNHISPNHHIEESKQQLKYHRKVTPKEYDAKLLKKLLPQPPLDVTLFWKCRFCTFLNIADPLKTTNQCRICETVQEITKEKSVDERLAGIEFDVPEQLQVNNIQCSQCGFKFGNNAEELCQCGFNPSELNEFLNSVDDDVASQDVEGKLGIELLKLNGIRGGAIKVRVWYPDARKIRFLGDFNKFGNKKDGNSKQYNMKKHESGIFSLYLEAPPGTSFIDQRFKYFVKKQNGEAEWRNDPRSLMLVGKKFINDMIYDNDSFEWTDQNFKPPPMNSYVIYETYIQSLADNKAEGAFLNAIKKLDYLKKLGINALELAPVTQDAHAKCWGYDPISLFAVHQTYGSANDLKIFINEAHKREIAVVFDWVPNHITKMIILHEGYFYDKADDRHSTRYGPRPNVGNPQVTSYLLDSLRSWINDFHFDAIRVDSVESMRFVTDSQKDIFETWTFFQEVTAMVHNEFPGKILIAEDLKKDHRINGIMGFDSQWDDYFFSVMLNAVKAKDDNSRNSYEIAMAIKRRFEASGFGRIIYSESHDTVCDNREFRIIKAVDPENKSPDLIAKRRSRLVGAVAFISVGIPMLMGGQELMESRGGIWPEIAPIPDFHKFDDLSEELKNSFRFFSDLIKLRLNVDGLTQGLRGSNIEIIHIHPSTDIPIIAVHRWDRGGPRDDVVIVMNFSNTSFKKEGYWIHFPRPGIWNVRLCSEGGGYGFLEKPKGTKFQVNISTVFDEHKRDGYMYAGKILLKKYVMMILSQD